MNATIDPRAVMAARNNADWYQMMAEVHGLRFERDAHGFAFRDPPPAYHSGITLTAPESDADIIANRWPGSGVKDAFARLDLTPFGLTPAIHATWIWCRCPVDADTSGWQRIATADDLAAWESAWRQTSPTDKEQFPPAMLEQANVVFWGQRSEAGFAAGGIVNTSVDCLGISNTFGAGALSAVANLAATTDLPLVGYDWGDDLYAACAAGFEKTGSLTIWFDQQD